MTSRLSCMSNPVQLGVDKLLCLAEEEQMVFTLCQHQPAPQWVLWCFTGQRWANEWEAEKERWGGQGEAWEGCLSTQSTDNQILRMCACGRGFGPW